MTDTLSAPAAAPIAARWRNLGELADRGLDPQRLALIDLREPGTARRYTHGEVDALADGVAQHLLQRGLRRGQRVAILALNRAEYIIAYFGIMRAGLVAVPVNIKLPRETIDYVLQDAGVALAFADAARRPLLDRALPVIDFDDPAGWPVLIRPARFEAVTAGPQEIGQMLYTSGSTGRPKGVPLSHAGQLWALSTRLQPGGEAERYILAQPLFHMNGLFMTKTVFASNASLVVLPAFETRAYTEALAEWRVTTLTAVPTMFARVVKEAELLARHDFSALRRIGLGSAPLTLGLIERLRATFPHAQIGHGYGTTEAGPAVFGPHPDGRPAPPLALGYPVAGGEVKLVGGATPEEGVLWMRNPAVMAGYHNLPERSARVLQDGWYDSGDLMRRDADGFYYFVGRADDMFVCSGENIYPAEVEKLLEAHPAIQQASVVPLPDEERGQVPVAFLVARPGAAPSAEAVKRFALERGPAYQHPRRIAFLAELPWAGTNKVDRAALIAEARAREAAGTWAR
ncbi:class I adenylate-forming enzyme family protein [Pseudoroseomonas cervicalis]|uniref:class I adenylate-forming enzyme family protein n=1 Tax=Teichococcus cervicalis TaxID=204525 RepID=UPI002789F01B|nr:class I adenylate-forming enzyme family protein [Pseudoroseomonas cervicalis]MDQ1081690.1 long-chain acyl-CoA synthetase [Pseudoroseomonas cervicalis]